LLKGDGNYPKLAPKWTLTFEDRAASLVRMISRTAILHYIHAPTAQSEVPRDLLAAIREAVSFYLP
jgi:hypothetical protein